MSSSLKEDAGFMYGDGRGVPPDDTKVLKLFRRAAGKNRKKALATSREQGRRDEDARSMRGKPSS